jgi:D-3-phosphoglycerate dehydrogenase
MKIAILNYSYLASGHIDALKKLGEVTEYPNTNTLEEAEVRLKGVEVAIADCFEISLNKEFFVAAKDLKYLCLNTTGYNLVDINAAKEKGILVSNLPGFSTEAVAEHAIALMFAVSRKLVLGDRNMRKAPFQINPAKRADDVYTGSNISGKTMGIVGLGKIGTRVAEFARGLGMKVIAYNRTPKQIPGVEMVDLDTLLRTSDVVTLATAYTPELKGFIGKGELAKLRPTAVLVNIARGELIDEAALIEALTNQKIAGLGADVFVDWTVNNPLFKLDNVVATPHMAFMTAESLKNMADIIVGNVKAYIEGAPQNVVNK